MLTINKLRVDCLIEKEMMVSNGKSPISNAAEKFKEIASKTLVEELQMCLKPLDNTDQTLVFIKQIEVNFDVDLLLSSKQIAKFWAENLKRKLIKKLSLNSSDNIVIFPNSVSYLSHFINDLIKGYAWQRWYYSKFSGLRMLTLSAAIRTAILDKPDIGLFAIREMASYDVLTLAKVLTEQDLNRILVGFNERVVAQKSGSLTLDEFVNMLTHEPVQFSSMSLNSIQAVFYYLIAALKIKPNSNNIKQIITYAKITYVLNHLKAQKVTVFENIIYWIKEHNIFELKKNIPTKLLLDLLPIFRFTKEDSAKLIQCVNHNNISLDGPVIENTNASFSRFGNCLFLLPHIKDLIEQSHPICWPDIANNKAINIISLISLSLCQGKEQFIHAFYDPLLQKLCGIKKSLNLKQVWEELSTLKDDEIQLSINHLSHYLLSNGGKVQAFKLDYRSTKIHIFEENKKGCWLNIIEALCYEGLERTPMNIEINETLNSVMEKDFDSLWLDSKVMAEIEVFFEDNKKFLNLLCLFTIIAQAAIKSFAFRLPGFAQSSVEYLLRNFLSMSINIVEKESCFKAYLSRVPMAVILNVTGINRSTIVLPEFDLRSIELYEQG